MRQRWIGVGAVVVAVAMAAVGCGSSTPAGSIFPKAYGATVGAKTAKLDLNIDVTTRQGHLTSTASGVISFPGRLARLDQTTNVGSRSVPTTEIVDGSDLYVQIPAAAQARLGGKPWLKVSIAQYQSASSGSRDPSQTLSLLEADSSSVTKVGTEKIDGVATTHYRAQVDTAKASARASAAGKRLLSELGSLSGSSTLPVDAWIDHHGMLRQLSYSVTLQHPPAGTPALAGPAFPVTTRVVLGLSHFGTPVTVSPPPADQVSTQSLSSLTGGAL